MPTFSQIEVNKYQKYANFGIDVEVVRGKDFGNPAMAGGYHLRDANPDIPSGSQGVKESVFRKTTPKTGMLLASVAGLGVAGAVGAGAYFIRRRRSKNGKQITERVRR